MRLSWNEIRARAAKFTREWADAAYEKSETQADSDDCLASSTSAARGTLEPSWTLAQENNHSSFPRLPSFKA